MSLDFAVLADDGRPRRSIPIGVPEHARLIAVANPSNLRFLGRFQDYYKDVTVPSDELPMLVEDILEARRVLGCGFHAGHSGPDRIEQAAGIG